MKKAIKLRSCVIIKSDDKILLMRRIKKNRDYYTIPGGKIEKGETPEETAIREIKEETNLDVVLGDKFVELVDDFHHGHYYLAASFNGKVELGGPERQKFSQDNQYYLEWWPLTEIVQLNLLPPKIKESILKHWNIKDHK